MAKEWRHNYVTSSTYRFCISLFKPEVKQRKKVPLLYIMVDYTHSPWNSSFLIPMKYSDLAFHLILWSFCIRCLFLRIFLKYQSSSDFHSWRDVYNPFPSQPIKLFSIFWSFPLPMFLLSSEKRGWLNTGKRRRENTFDKKIKLLEAEGQRFTTYSQSRLAYFVQRHCSGMRRGWFLCLQFRTSYLMFLLMCQTQSQCLWR